MIQDKRVLPCGGLSLSSGRLSHNGFAKQSLRWTGHDSLSSLAVTESIVMRGFVMASMGKMACLDAAHGRLKSL